MRDRRWLLTWLVLAGCAGEPLAPTSPTSPAAPSATSSSSGSVTRASSLATDTDSDAILDSCDQCPNDSENYNAHRDWDGCPDIIDRSPDWDAVQILARVPFHRGSVGVPKEAASALDELAVIMTNPDVERVAILGHASIDEQDADRVSQERADAVLKALVARGVAAARLEAHGMGARKPVEDTAARNRRADFKILRLARREQYRWNGADTVPVPHGPIAEQPAKPGCPEQGNDP